MYKVRLNQMSEIETSFSVKKYLIILNTAIELSDWRRRIAAAVSVRAVAWRTLPLAGRIQTSRLN